MSLLSEVSTPAKPITNRKSMPLTPLYQSALCNSILRNATSKKSLHSNFSCKTKSPLTYKLDVVQSDWTLTGTGPSPRRSNQIRKTTVELSDRFISQKASCSASVPTETEEKPAEGKNLYTKSVAEACGVALNTRILSFKPLPPECKKSVFYENCYNRPLKNKSQAKNNKRKISVTPERVLDAPGLIDDYYLNLLDWSSNNQVAIGLEKTVYIWSAETGKVISLGDNSAEAYVTSIRWSEDGNFLAVGFTDGDLQIWDVELNSKLRSMLSQETRIGSSSWNKHLLTTGCRSGKIINDDVRIREHKISEFSTHRAEVCGLEWRSDGAQLASGGNDNLLCIWDSRFSVPKFTKTNHTAAVKALAWCPWQLNLLSTGGGTADRRIHWWNTTTGARIQSIDTGSQVTSLCWSSVYKEIVSTHGWPDNQLSIWNFGSSIQKQMDIPAHESRVLHSSLSPDGQTIATAAADENLKFFRVWSSEDRPTRLRDDTNPKELRKCLTIR